MGKTAPKPGELQGARARGDPKRPLIAKFLRYQEKELIRRSAVALKGTSFGLGEQFPKEIHKRRKTLYPVFKRAKQERKKPSIVKDKLYINGSLYRTLAEDML